MIYSGNTDLAGKLKTLLFLIFLLLKKFLLLEHVHGLINFVRILIWF